MNEIACVIPTYKRKQMCIECVQQYTKNCTIPTDIIIIDDASPSGTGVTQSDFDQLAYNWGQHKIQVINQPVNGGIGCSRKTGVDIALERGYEYILNLDDDAFIAKGCIEKLYNVIRSHPKIGFCGSIGNYTRWIKDADPDLLIFHKNISIVYFFKSEAIRDVGHFDARLRAREDIDVGIRMWRNGWVEVGVVDADVEHRRHQPGGLISEGEAAHDKWWFESCDIIKQKYGDKVTVTSNGAIKYKAPFPEECWVVDKNGLNMRTMTKEEYIMKRGPELVEIDKRRAERKAKKEAKKATSEWDAIADARREDP